MSNTNQYIAAWQTNNLAKNATEQLTKDAKHYPYFSALQLLYCANDTALNNNHKAQNIHLSAAYKGNLFLWWKNFITFKTINAKTDVDDLILPPFVDNYFAAQKISATEQEVDNYVEEQILVKEKTAPAEVDENSLMITMSFDEWLHYFKQKKEQEKKDLEGKQALRAMWQKEKLSAANEEENELIPENVFKMAIDSIHLGENTVSESLAQIMLNQGKTDKAIEMYRKLSLLNPEKSSYFAHKIKEVTKNNN